MPETIFSSFGLAENPFKINPDPRFIYLTDEARATSDELAYAIRTRKGLILLTGEVGTGKTMLIRRLLDWLAEENMPTALIFNSHIKPEHLLDFILNDFGVACASKLKSEKLMALNRWLLERYRAGQIPVLIVDEAQGLDTAALEEIRLLLNFETPREKLLQIVLAGQPELELNLRRHELRQLRQRVTIRCRTSPLTLEQTSCYLQQRLRVAGASGHPIFDSEAIGSVHAFSRGIPRVINVLCEHSLINACADGLNTVSMSQVAQAATDCQLDRADYAARILNSGSYSSATLAGASAAFAPSISASPETARPFARPRFADPFAATSGDVPRPVERSAMAEPAAVPVVERTVPKPHPVVSDAAPAVAARSDIREQPPARAAEMPAAGETYSVRNRHSAFHFLNGWRASFTRDVVATSRRVRRALHSFQVRRWEPFVRSTRRELADVYLRASRIGSNPIWGQLVTRATSESREAWRRVKLAVPSKRKQSFGSQEDRELVQNGAPRRTTRPRAILSVRRWLHEPLTQRKRTEASQRRSAS